MSASVKKNFLWNASYQLLLVLVPLVTTPYLSRVLGPERVGVYSYTFSVANYFVLFATLGMANYGARLVASAGADRAKRSRLFWSAYAAQLCVAVPVLIAYALYAFIGQQGGPLVAAVWGMWVLSAALDISWLFFGVEDFRLATERSVVTKLASVVAILLFVKGPDDLWIYCAAIAGSFLANQLLLWPFAVRHVDRLRPTWAEVRAHFAPNLRLFAPVVAISLYTSLDKIMLGAISGMEQAGYFEYSEKISKLPMAVVTALGTVMLPRMTSELALGKVSEARRLLGESMRTMQAAAVAMTFGIVAVAPEFVPVFFGPGYDSCILVMAIVSATIPLISASNVIGVQYMLPAFSDRAYTISVCVGAAVNLALNVLLLGSLGAVGAAVATVAAEAAVLVVQCWVVRHDLPLARYLKEALPFVAIGAAMVIIVRLFAEVVSSGVAGLILEVIAGGIFYCFASFAWLKATGDEMLSRFVPRGRRGR